MIASLVVVLIVSYTKRPPPIGAAWASVNVLLVGVGAWLWTRAEVWAAHTTAWEVIEAYEEELGVNYGQEGGLDGAPKLRSGGRKPAIWWPDFAEELAVYVHEDGLPAGTDTEGQSEVIEAIFHRMAEREKPEPGRPTVQPVINAVLRRVRSAGN